MINRIINKQAAGYIERHLTSDKGDAWHIINAEELRVIRNIRIKAYLMAAFVGAFFVVALYLPVYLWPDSFLTREDHFDVWGWFEFDFKVVFLVYSFLILPPEIWAIRLINLWATARICSAFGFSPRDDEERAELMDVAQLALERKDKRLKRFGINPYVGVPLSYIVLINVWMNFRQTLSNMAFKTLVRFGVGAESASIVVDFSGIPVFMVWNSFTTNTAIQNVIRRMMARSLVKELSIRVPLADERMQRLTFLCIYYTSNIKRSYHPNHLVMLSGLLGNLKDLGKLEKWAMDYDPDSVLDEIRALPRHEKEWLEKVLLMGMFVDGSLGVRDKKHLQFLQEKGVTTLQGNEAIRWCNDFKHGRFDVNAYLESVHKTQVTG
jgi:hypothetical protein